MGSYLDIRTLSFVAGLVSILLAGSMLFILKSSKTYKGFSLWTAGFIMNALGMILLSLRHIVPDFISIVVGNSAILCYPILCDIGISQFYNRKVSVIFNSSSLLILVLSFLYLTYLSPNIIMRIVVVSVLMVGILLHTLHTLLTYTKTHQKKQQWIMILGYGIVIFWLIIRLIAMAISGEEIKDLMTSGIVQAMAFIVLIVGPILTTLGLTIMNHQRLEEDLLASTDKVTTLSQLIPICSNCHKVRDDDGYWGQVEEYISSHTDYDFSHSICPQCMHELYPDMNLDDELC